MALTVGELVAYAQIDKSDFRRGTREIAGDLRALQSSTSSSMNSMESTVVRSLADIERAIADGLDPSDAIRDLDRLEAALDASFREMEADADRFSRELEREIDEAFDELDRAHFGDIRFDVDANTLPARAALNSLEADAHRAGERAADEFWQGADGRWRSSATGRFVSAAEVFGGLVDAATDAGKKTGDALSDGVGVLGKVGPAQVAIVAGAIQLLPTVASVAATGIVLAVGGALAAVGITAAAQAEEVKKAWKDLGETLKAELADAAQPLEGSLIRAADVAEKTFRKIKPALKRIFQDMVPDIDILVDGIGEGVQRIMPHLEKVGQSFGMMISNLGRQLPEIMETLGETFTAFSEMMDDDPEMLANLVQDAADLLRVGAEVLAWADDISAAFQFITQANPTPLVDKLMGGSPQEQLEQLEQVPKNLADMQTAVQGSIDAINGMGSSAKEGADGVKSLSAALEEFFAPAQDALAAQNDWRDALQDANKAIKDGNLSTLDRSKQLENLLGTLARNAAAEREATGATDRSSAAFEKNAGMLVKLAGNSEAGRGALDGLAASLGYTVERAGKATVITDELGNKIKVLPSGKVVKLEADSKDADSKLETTKGKIGDLKDKKVKVEGDTKQAQDEVKKVKTGLDGLEGDARAAGKDLGSGLVAGIRSMIGGAIDAAKALAKSALDGAKNFLGIKSPSTVMAEVGKWTVKGLIQGLTSEEANVKSTVERMVKQVKEAFSSQPDVADHLLKFIQVGNKNLEDLALQREALVQRLADAKELAKKVAGDAQEWAAITGLKPEDFSGAGDFAQELRDRASAINNFANNINTLAKRGLNKATIQQIIDAGVEKGATFAEMLVGSDGSEIKALNKAQAAVDKASKKLGKASADAMYDTGKKAGEGYLKGLQDSLKKLDKEMEKIVKALVAAIKKHLKIKSPSQVMAEIGQYSMEGLIVGMDSMASQVVAAAEQITQQAVTAAQAAAGGRGLVAGHLPGGPVTALVGGKPATVGLGLEGQGVAYKPAAEPAQTAQPAVNVNIDSAVVREEADFAKIGSAVTFAVMGRGMV